MTLFSLNSDRRVLRRNFITYIGVVIFCILFGIIYEMNGHGVISYFTLLGFLFPLGLGLIPYSLLYLFKLDIGPGMYTSYAYNAGVATLTVGSYFTGMLEIYGTTRDVYVIIYFAVGSILLITGIVFYIISLIKSKKNRR